MGVLLEAERNLPSAHRPEEYLLPDARLPFKLTLERLETAVGRLSMYASKELTSTLYQTLDDYERATGISSTGTPTKDQISQGFHALIESVEDVRTLVRKELGIK